MASDIEQHDHHRRRCPMLGHEVSFSYCRAPGRDLPCRRVFDCWWGAFDVESFIRAHFSQEQIGLIVAPQKAKVASLVELIEQARKRNQ